MIIAETNPVLIKRIREKETAAIITWFGQRKNSLYKLATIYVKNFEVIQDIFYNVMVKVQEEIRELKKNASFENWVISLFLEECKQVQMQNSAQGVLENLDKTNKDTIALTYLLGLTHDKVAEILKIPVEMVRARLHKGIQNLTEMEEGHYQEIFLDYVSRTLERSKKIELEIHLHSCKSCQRGLAAFQQTVYLLIDEAEAIDVPGDFLDDVIKRLNENDTLKKKKIKKRTTTVVGIVSSLIFLLLIGYVTNSFSYMYYSWLDWRNKEDEQLLAILKSGLVEPLNLVQESNGIKVTIKTAVADEFQTLIYYEVENLKGEEQYGINFWNGVFIEDETKIFDQLAIPVSQLPVQPLEHEGEVFKGTIGLMPISSDTETIKLNISKLQKMEKDAEKNGWIDFYGEGAFTTGKWNFEIPVKKHESTEHRVEKKFIVDEVPIEIEKLIMAPTLTVLQYRFEPYEGDININEILFEEIQTKEKTVKPILVGWNFPVHNWEGSYATFQSIFDSLYFDNPEEVNVHLNSLSYYKNDSHHVKLDLSQSFPQAFDYLGSKISIDKIEEGASTKIQLTAEMSEDRIFESILFNILSRNDFSEIPMGTMDIEGVMVDRNGNIYNTDEYDYSYYANMDVNDMPRYYETKVIIEVNNAAADEEMIPGWIQIQGYRGTSYVDDIVNIKLK